MAEKMTGELAGERGVMESTLPSDGEQLRKLTDTPTLDKMAKEVRVQLLDMVKDKLRDMYTLHESMSTRQHINEHTPVKSVLYQ